MDISAIGQALVMGVVEGLTEFLPISSTGHLILTGDLIAFHGDKAKVFEVFIQLGAILAVLWTYRAKVFSLLSTMHTSRESRNFGAGIMVAFVPAAGVGFLAHDYIKSYLFNSVSVAVALVLGGLAILWIERRRHAGSIDDITRVGLTVALAVGIAQVFALIPGVSRSGATIMGGLLAGMSRKASTEFSFFLAIPTMMAATVYDLAKSADLLSPSDFGVLSVGFVAAFVSALWVVKWLIRFVSTNDFKPFAYYRIAFGGIILALWSANVIKF